MILSCKESDKEPTRKCRAPINAEAYFSLLGKDNSYYPTIVFCPSYFTLPSLGERVKILQGNKKYQNHPSYLKTQGRHQSQVRDDE